MSVFLNLKFKNDISSVIPKLRIKNMLNFRKEEKIVGCYINKDIFFLFGEEKFIG
jgi:hypothetical protein